MSSIVVKNFFRDERQRRLAFGEWLLQKRKQSGLTQEALAKAANDVCTAGYISNLERNQDVGKRGQPTRPNEAIVEALAAALADACKEPRELVIREARLAAGYAAPAIEIDQEQFNRSRLANIFLEFEDLPEDEQEEMGPILEMVRQEIRRRKQAGELASQKNSQAS